MDTTQLAEKIATMKPEEMRAALVANLEIQREAAELKKKVAALQQNEEQIKLAAQKKQFDLLHGKYGAALKNAGLSDDKGAVAQDVASVYEYMLTDDHAQKVGAHKFATTIMDKNIQQAAELEKLTAENAKLQTTVELLKRPRGAVAPPSQQSNKVAFDKSNAEIGSQLQKEAATAGAASRADGVAPKGQPHPLSRTPFMFPIQGGKGFVSFSQPGSNPLTGMTQQPQTILVRQSDAAGGAKTGDAADQWVPAPANPVLDKMASQLTGTPNIVYNAAGIPVDLTKLYDTGNNKSAQMLTHEDLAIMAHQRLNESLYEPLMGKFLNANTPQGRYVDPAKQRGRDE